MSQQIPDHFTGYAAHSAEDGRAFKVSPTKLKPQEWTEDMVDIKISCCGVCGSCIHTITDGWGGTSYPCTVGHEIVGTIVRAGSKSGRKEGERVAVGAQGGSCLNNCEPCKNNDENHCLNGMIGTYQGKWQDGTVAQGGYADYWRGMGRFAVKVPEALSDESAAPMACGGVTTYTPLVENGAGPGKTVGIVGIGGLGHYGLLWSKALGADTYAISHSHSKESDVAKMLGTKDRFIATGDGVEEVAKKYKNTFDLLIVTTNQRQPPIQDLYVPLLKPRGKIVFVGLAEDKLPALPPSVFTVKSISIGGSIIGSPKQIADMYDLAVKHKVDSWIEVRPMSETGKTLQDMSDGKARYRYVLSNKQ